MQRPYHKSVNWKKIFFYVLFVIGGCTFLNLTFSKHSASIFTLLFSCLSIFLFYQNHSRYANKTFKVLLKNIVSFELSGNCLNLAFTYNVNELRSIAVNNIYADLEIVNNYVNDLINDNASSKNKPQHPKCLYEITFDEIRIVLSHPDLNTVHKKWKDIHAIEIQTSDKGLFSSDRWLILKSKNQEIRIPEGAYNFDMIINHIHRFYDLDRTSITDNPRSLSNKAFSIWSRN